ncbi:MAG: hypothetical protein OEZ68_03685 [Gammaproteobacteria bacterium]|nr:hypothetical protein [Gammaproteobacteria bacterium]MDH5799886.1 hypothetical protein [Gammaproteobacteria bacterium]
MDTGNQEPLSNRDEQILLAQQAAAGDPVARSRVNQFLDPIIRFQTDRFCKRFCKENQFIYTCTLPKPWGTPASGAALCEWGNASYAWMLDDLSNAKRLQQYRGDNGASLNNYMYHIANSLPFYERWKNWRFGRKVHVPTYIQSMGPQAGSAFLALRSGDNIALIAQKLSLSEADTEILCRKIIVTLTQKNRLHLLNPPSTISLSQDYDGNETEMEPADASPSLEQTADHDALHQAWQLLNPTEQFVLESMVMDQQDANDVLNALEKLDIRIKDGVPPQQTNRQHLYYFRRKTLAKLEKLMESS